MYNRKRLLLLSETLRCLVRRLMAQFAFSLSPDWELPTKKDMSQPLKEGVRDMLVKHHLFSWDI